MKIEAIETWAPHSAAAPLTERQGDGMAVASNGTRTCVGGWQVVYSGVEAGQAYRIRWDLTHRDVAEPRDSLRGKAYWGRMQPDSSRPDGEWHYLLPSEDVEAMARTLVAPVGVDTLTLRCTFRWSTTGESVWVLPDVEAVDAETAKPVSVAVVTGRSHDRRRAFDTIQDNIDFYAPLTKDALEQGAALVVLPEIALQYGLPDHNLDCAVGIDAPETRPFSDLAKEYGVRVLLGLVERDEDAVFNTAALYGPDGLEGRYHKVHLAVGGESESGILAGTTFPVFETPIGRIGCNICMDSSAAESSRMVGLAGADFLLLPIMGDHRADRWSRGQPVFNEDRWKAIMRTHALDNQLVMVVARNTSQGSCVVDRKGDFLAYNEGDVPTIIADVDLGDGYRTWNGGCFRDVNWMQRRPHLYGAEIDANCYGSLAEVPS